MLQLIFGCKVFTKYSNSSNFGGTGSKLGASESKVVCAEAWPNQLLQMKKSNY